MAEIKISTKNNVPNISISGAKKTTVDTELSSTSTNPVQNKAVTAALDTKVDKVEGKGLSTNDYTQEDALMLNSHENKINSLENDIVLKVDKISGKGLSTNDYTTEEKQKLKELPTSSQMLGLFEQTSNKVTDITESSTDTQYPSAAAVYLHTLGISARMYAVLGEYVHKSTDSTDDISTATPATAYYPTAQAVKDYAQPKTDVQSVAIIEDDDVSFSLGNNNRETRYFNLPVASLAFIVPNGEYDIAYTEGLVFDSGSTPTHVSYSSTGIIQWVGTDCFISDDNKSVFKPSANTHYDIVFYYNGDSYIVGLVNGYKTAVGNQEANT